MSYEPKQFNIPKLKGISEKAIEEHLKLYEGYVKHTNLILEEVAKLNKNDGPSEHQFAITEMQRRFSFEFDGMRNHEIYFESFSGGGAENGGEKSMSGESALKSAIEAEWGSFEKWLKLFKGIAKTRGIGWAMLYFDPNGGDGGAENSGAKSDGKKSGRLLNGWVDEQHLGHLNGLVPIIALDMWEHSFVGDYWPSGKGAYVDDFFENVNWRFFESRYDEAVK